MSEYVNLNRIIEFLDDIGQPIRYQEFRTTFEEKVKTEHYHENILNNAKQLLVNDLIANTTLLKYSHVSLIFLFIMSPNSHVEFQTPKRTNVTCARDLFSTNGTRSQRCFTTADTSSITDVLKATATNVACASMSMKKFVSLKPFIHVTNFIYREHHQLERSEKRVVCWKRRQTLRS